MTAPLALSRSIWSVCLGLDRAAHYLRGGIFGTARCFVLHNHPVGRTICFIVSSAAFPVLFPLAGLSPAGDFKHTREPAGLLDWQNERLYCHWPSWNKIITTTVSRRFTDYAGAASQDSSSENLDRRPRLSLFERLHIRTSSLRRRSRSRSGSHDHSGSSRPSRPPSHQDNPENPPHEETGHFDHISLGEPVPAPSGGELLNATGSSLKEAAMPHPLAANAPPPASSKRQRSQDSRNRSSLLSGSDEDVSGSQGGMAGERGRSGDTARVPPYLTLERIGT